MKSTLCFYIKTFWIFFEPNTCRTRFSLFCLLEWYIYKHTSNVIIFDCFLFHSLWASLGSFHLKKLKYMLIQNCTFLYVDTSKTISIDIDVVYSKIPNKHSNFYYPTIYHNLEHYICAKCHALFWCFEGQQRW